MNSKTLKLNLIRYGLKEDNTFICILDTAKDEISSFYADKEYIFVHITDTKKATITEIEEDYAKMFLLHNLNLIVFDETDTVQIVFKLDGTVITYEA